MQITVLIMMGLIPQEGTVQYSDSKTETDDEDDDDDDKNPQEPNKNRVRL